MRLGCNTVVFAQKSLPEALARVAWCGFQEVEFAAIPGMCEHISPDRDKPDEVKHHIANSGLRPAAIEAAMNLSDPQTHTRFLAIFEFAAQIGVEVVNTGSGGKSDDRASEEAVYTAIRQLAPRAQELGITLGIKTHVNQAIYNTKSALQALEAVPVAGWGINYDASHLYRLGDDVVQSVHQLRGKIASAHIRDTLEQVIPIGPPPTQIPGRGRIDLAGVINALTQIDYQGPLNLEVIGTKALEDWQAVAIAAESRGYLHRLQETARPH